MLLNWSAMLAATLLRFGPGPPGTKDRLVMPNAPLMRRPAGFDLCKECDVMAMTDDERANSSILENFRRSRYTGPHRGQGAARTDGLMRFASRSSAQARRRRTCRRRGCSSAP